MAKFNLAMQFILDWEGGYINDPHDPGGETKFGISKRAYPKLDISKLTKEHALKIYYDDYWTPTGADQLHTPLAFLLMDASVNMGVRVASSLVQRTVGSPPDGFIGPDTIACCFARMESAPTRTLVKFQQLRSSRYLSFNNQAEERYERGWLNRVIDGMAYAQQLLDKGK